MFNVTWRPESLGNSLQLRCRFGIIGLELNKSFSGKVFKRAEMLSVKSKGNSRIIFFEWSKSIFTVEHY